MTENPPTSPRRHRGGQPGNHNAVTHGLYARKYRAALRASAASLTSASTLHEDLLFTDRFIRRLADELNPASVDLTSQSQAAVLNFALLILTRHLRKLGFLEEKITPALEAALSEVLWEIKTLYASFSRGEDI